jgi:hypothetical protein
LTFDLDPYHLVWWLLTPQILLYANDDVPLMENKNLYFGGKIQFLRYEVTKWRHNVKILTDLESTHQGFSWGTTRYGTVDFKIWPWGKQILTRSETHEGQGWSVQKTNQLSGSPYATFKPSLELIWIQQLKK